MPFHLYNSTEQHLKEPQLIKQILRIGWIDFDPLLITKLSEYLPGWSEDQDILLKILANQDPHGNVRDQSERVSSFMRDEDSN